MGKLDAERTIRNRTEMAGGQHHRALAAPLMGPQAETLDRLMGRTEEELRATDFRQRQSKLADVRAAYVARHCELKP